MKKYSLLQLQCKCNLCVGTTRKRLVRIEFPFNDTVHVASRDCLLPQMRVSSAPYRKKGRDSRFTINVVTVSSSSMINVKRRANVSLFWKVYHIGESSRELYESAGECGVRRAVYKMPCASMRSAVLVSRKVVSYRARVYATCRS